MLLVAGASGFLGQNFTREALASGREVVAAVHRNVPEQTDLRIVEADLTQASAAGALLSRFEPEWVINCAALTNVDECERHPGRARALNSDLPRMLASACAQAGVGLVHISTDSVFDGRRGNYSEDDAPAPVNVYAETKLEGEHAVQDVLPEALVIRTNFIGMSESRKWGLADWITARFECGEPFDGFTDVVFSPLLANELARFVLAAIESRLQGLYHAAAGDSCTKYDFACRLGAALGFDTRLVHRASLVDAKLTAQRPLNTSLSSSRLEKALARKMPSVEAAISGYVELRATGLAATPFRI